MSIGAPGLREHLAGDEFVALVLVRFPADEGFRRHALEVNVGRVVGPDVKLRVERDAPAFYPDLFVVCRPIDASAAELDEAKLIVEVLSPSTEKKDRGGKWIEYQKLAMLREYVLIDPDKRRIEIFRRAGEFDWRLHICNQTEAVRFESIEFGTSFDLVFEDLR